jgi:hypothetical protein
VTEMPIRRNMVAGAALVCTAMVAAGCSSSPASSRSSPPAKAAPLPIGSGASTLKAALLSAADLQAIQGAPAGIEITPPSSQGSLFQDPDPRSPCGARVNLPDFSQGAKVQFQSPTVAAFQVVIDEPVAQATSFATVWQRGTRPGCPPFMSRTSNGSSQIADLVAPIALPHLVDQATGAWSTINDNGQTVNSYGLVLRSGGRLEFDVLFAPAALAQTFVVGFARAAESALKGSLGSH